MDTMESLSPPKRLPLRIAARIEIIEKNNKGGVSLFSLPINPCALLFPLPNLPTTATTQRGLCGGTLNAISPSCYRKVG